MKTHAYEYRYAKPPGTFGRCHCLGSQSLVRVRMGKTLPLLQTSTTDDIEKGEPVAYLRLSRRERLEIQRLGQHVHAWIEEVASEGSVLSRPGISCLDNLTALR